MSDFPLPLGTVIEDGVWVQAIRPVDADRPALFLDRDGVVVEEVNYLHKVEDARLETGAAEVIARANALGVPVVVVTNQAGIGYGYYGWDEFSAVQDRILDDLRAAGAFVDAVLACPFHAKGKPPYQHPSHPARKPNPGMLVRAQRLLGLDMARSWIVGDRASDLEAGLKAGIAGGVHVLTGHGAREGEREAALTMGDGRFEAKTADSIAGIPVEIPLFGA